MRPPDYDLETSQAGHPRWVPGNHIYIYKVVISVILLVCLSDHNLGTSLTNMSQILIGELGRTTGMLLVWFLNFKLSGSTFIGKNSSNYNLRPSAGKRRK